MKKRYTIAFLSDVFIGDYNYPLWRGIIERTKNREINLMSFCLSPVLLDEKIEFTREYIHKVISKSNFDGIILCGGLLVQRIGYEEVYHISKNIFSIPIVNVGVNYDDIPSIMTDNYMGTYSLMEHLITHHNYKRIAFVRGTRGNIEENERFHAYKNALQAHSVSFNQDYVTRHYLWSNINIGPEVIRELKKKCYLDLDAIVCSNDFQAFSVMGELHHHDIHCPDNIAITGFDNISFSAQLQYLLTTCSNPTHKLGIKAVDVILDQIKGKTDFKDVIKIPSELIIRHSCGCFPSFHRETVNKYPKQSQLKLKGQLDIKVIVYSIKKKILNQIQGIDRGIFSTPLFDKIIYSFIEDVIKNNSTDTSEFLSTFKKFIIFYIKGVDKNLNTVRFIIDDIFTIVKTLSLNPAQYSTLENLNGEIWKIIGYAEELIQVDNRAAIIRQSHELFWVNMEISSVLNLEKMMDVLAVRLPLIGITQFYMFLYDEKNPGLAHLIMGYDERGDTRKQIKSTTFPSATLLPEGFFSNNHAFSLLVEPLLIRTRHLGYVIMDTKSQEDFVYFTISLQISTFLKKVLALKQLRQTMGTIINTLVATVETRDPYTAGHQKRVSDLARCIAIAMKLPQESIETIRMAAQIHDIGKIAIPSEILSKPSKLTKLEYDFIKTHSRNGYDILKNIDFSGPVAETVLQHHEKIDGSGYPGGLMGDEILLEAKIITVADVVEAMSSHRPYRPQLGINFALAEIEKNKGILYDPEIVDICVMLFEKNNFTFKKLH